MSKHYTIEVAVNAQPIEHLAKLNGVNGIHISVYGGIPDSPLNGGRNNFLLDNYLVFGRFLFSISTDQLSLALKRFYENIEKANSKGIPYYLALTNMFVSQKELTPENMYPVDRLVEISRKYGVKNGLTLYSKVLEDHIRNKYGDELVYISSCTKYTVPERILSPKETLKMYLEDAQKYDYVVLTPQDSRREQLMVEAAKEHPQKIMAICNSYCLNSCNCYQHYELFSKENKKSLLTIKAGDVLINSMLFMVPRLTNCSALTEAFRKSNYKEIALMQLRSGIVNFKLGRGFGEDFLDQLVGIISDFKPAETLV